MWRRSKYRHRGISVDKVSGSFHHMLTICAPVLGLFCWTHAPVMKGNDDLRRSSCWQCTQTAVFSNAKNSSRVRSIHSVGAYLHSLKYTVKVFCSCIIPLTNPFQIITRIVLNTLSPDMIRNG